MTGTESNLVETAIAAGVGVIILCVIALLIWAFIMLIRRTPSNALQVSGLSLADGMLKTYTELSFEMREDSKRREAISTAQTAATNAQIEVLRAIHQQMIADGTTLKNVHAAVTTGADARQVVLLDELHRISAQTNRIEVLLMRGIHDYYTPPIYRANLRAAASGLYGSWARQPAKQPMGYSPDPAIDSGNYTPG